jgi:hypothetical protein
MSLRSPFASGHVMRPRAPVTRALVASIALHALLLVTLSGVVGSMPVRVPLPPTLSARIVTESPHPVEPSVATPPAVAQPSPPPEPLPERPPVAIAAAPALAPRPVTPAVFARAYANVEADGAIDEIFTNALHPESTQLPRVPLEFTSPLDIQAKERVVRDVPQRRVRGLVRVHASAQVELLVVDEYDDELVLAIRNALDRTQARPPAEGAAITPGWAIVVFWFERATR